MKRELHSYTGLSFFPIANNLGLHMFLNVHVSKMSASLFPTSLTLLICDSSVLSNKTLNNKTCELYVKIEQ